jgi:alkylhydroperoxidase family enzyme
MTVLVKQLRKPQHPHEWPELADKAADEIERLTALMNGDAAEILRLNREIERLRAATMVYCVLCVDDRDRDRVHIFTTQERAEVWASTDPRRHIIYDYLLNHPERMEKQAQ